MTRQELTSPYFESTTSQQGMEPCRVLPAPQVTVPVTETCFEVFPKLEWEKFPREIVFPQLILGDCLEMTVSMFCMQTLPQFFGLATFVTFGGDTGI